MTEKNKVFPTEEELKAAVEVEVAKVSNLPEADSDLLKKIYSCMDLTSLNSTDGPVFIENWLNKVVFDVLPNHPDLLPGAICVYSNFSRLVKTMLKGNFRNKKQPIIIYSFRS